MPPFPLQAVLAKALSFEPLARTARTLSDWVDLEASSLIKSLTALAPQTKGRLLDVGCGEKPYEHIFRPFVDDYLGIEYSETFAETSAASKPGKADFVYDGKVLPFEDKCFDTVVSIQVLEHTPAPAALVVEMGRVLRDDGLLLLSAPFCFRLHEEPHDYFRYSPHALRLLCEQAGLHVTHMEPRGGLFSVIGHKLNSYLALNVAHIDAVAQSLGKLGHERVSERGARWWTVPWVAPTMATIALGARVLDRVLPDPTEALGFVLMARRSRG
ncbi:MAG TPA: class I SAM-dependent methyltransferase [Polyangiaceae bacterium]|nr:class I SAM-dependent methyltransferase [Polyangiaceae bacterium]